MSTELKGTNSLNGEVLLNRYFGGSENGTCIQVTPMGGNPYLSLSKTQALELAAALIEFVNGTREEKGD